MQFCQTQVKHFPSQIYFRWPERLICVTLLSYNASFLSAKRICLFQIHYLWRILMWIPTLLEYHSKGGQCIEMWHWGLLTGYRVCLWQVKSGNVFMQTILNGSATFIFSDLTYKVTVDSLYMYQPLFVFVKNTLTPAVRMLWKCWECENGKKKKISAEK